MQEKNIILLKPNKKFIILLIFAVLISLINFFINLINSLQLKTYFLVVEYSCFMSLLSFCLYFLVTIFFVKIEVSKNKILVHDKIKTPRQYGIKNIFLTENKFFILVPTDTILSFFIPILFLHYKDSQNKIWNIIKSAPVVSTNELLKIILVKSIYVKIFVLHFFLLFLFIIFEGMFI